MSMCRHAPAEMTMHQTNSSLRIAELEAVLDSTIEFLKKLPTHPMTSMVIKGAEAKLYAPANHGIEGREAEGLISRSYAPNGALLIGVESTSKDVTITTGSCQQRCRVKSCSFS